MRDVLRAPWIRISDPWSLIFYARHVYTVITIPGKYLLLALQGRCLLLRVAGPRSLLYAALTLFPVGPKGKENHGEFSAASNCLVVDFRGCNPCLKVEEVFAFFRIAETGLVYCQVICSPNCGAVV